MKFKKHQLTFVQPEPKHAQKFMKDYHTKLLLLFLFINISAHSFSQASDFLVFKKRGKTIESFFSGKEISFKTINGAHSGYIDHISKDTIYLTQYDIRKAQSRLGFYIMDTFAVYHLSFKFKDITGILKNKNGTKNNAVGASFFGTGGLLTLLGLGSWVVTKKDTKYYARPEFVGTTAALTALGYVILKTSTDEYKLGKKYTLDYIGVK